MARRAKTETIISAMRILADGIYSADGAANAAVAEAADRLAELNAQATKVCAWVEDGDYGDYGGIYDGSCGLRWAFVGDPKENNMNFCPQCGGRVKIGKRKAEAHNGV